MDKRDWKEAKRREKAAAAGATIQTLCESTSASPQSPVPSRKLAGKDRGQTRVVLRWMRRGVCCGHMEVWTRTHYVPVLEGAYLLYVLHISGYCFGSVAQERYSTIVLCALQTRRKCRFIILRYGRENAWAQFW